MGFPEAPRRVRLRAAAAIWWPLGLTAGVTLFAVTVVLLVLLGIEGFRMPFDDWALEAQSVVSSREATVQVVRPTSAHFGSQVVHEVEYSFENGDGSERRGTCYTMGERFKVGTRVPLEYRASDPALQRPRGSVLAQATLWFPWLMPIWLGLFVLTGFWGSRVWRLRVMLRHGPAAEATLVKATPTRGVNPPQVRVQYKFGSRAGQREQGSHWLRASGPLARRIQDLAPGTVIPGAAAVYDEAKPERNRLLAEEDAEPER